MITLDKITKTYPPHVHALQDVSMAIEQGEFVAIMGKSGSGKSTLMSIIGFLDRSTSGHYSFRSKNVEKLTRNELAVLRMREIGFVFQHFNLLPRLNAWRNVALPMAYASVSRKERKQKALALLRQVGLEDRAAHLPSMLSGGESQRVAIARALANDPALIIADEPTGSLDSDTGRKIIEMFCEFHRQGRTVIVVTHDAHIASYAQRIINVHDGRVVDDGLSNECKKTLLHPITTRFPLVEQNVTRK